MMTLAPSEFERLEAIILSDQIPADELQALLLANPDFAQWYQKRAEARADSVARDRRPL